MDSKTVTRLGLLAVAALQVALILVLVVPKERTLATGETVVLQTTPVDPRDLFRGDYVVLRYEISTEPHYEGLGPGETVYVGLYKSGPVWRASYVSRTKPIEGLFIGGARYRWLW